MSYTPPSVRFGNRRAKLNWWFKGRCEAVALWLAPWLNPRRPEPRPAIPSDHYARAIALWGSDPEAWPPWNCQACGQRNSGWSLQCGRCERIRVLGRQG